MSKSPGLLTLISKKPSARKGKLASELRGMIELNINFAPSPSGRPRLFRELVEHYKRNELTKNDHEEQEEADYTKKFSTREGDESILTTPCARDEDWIFASPRMNGKQPLWPESVMKNRIPPAAKRAAINKHVTWHAFRHSFSTLLVANGNDVKTVQHLMRHANPRVTLGLCTGAVDEKSRNAQSQIVQQMLPYKLVSAGAVGMPEGKDLTGGVCPYLCTVGITHPL